MYKFIITNTDSLEIANKINDYLLKAKLSPCVQILSGIDSRYMWKGKIESHKEYLILIKCKNSNSEEIVKHIKRIISKSPLSNNYNSSHHNNFGNHNYCNNYHNG